MPVVIGERRGGLSGKPHGYIREGFAPDARHTLDGNLQTFGNVLVAATGDGQYRPTRADFPRCRGNLQLRTQSLASSQKLSRTRMHLTEFVEKSLVDFPTE